MSSVLALRLLPPLLAAAAAAALLPRLAGWSAAQVLALVGPLLLCGVAPAPQQVSPPSVPCRRMAASPGHEGAA